MNPSLPQAADRMCGFHFSCSAVPQPSCSPSFLVKFYLISLRQVTAVPQACLQEHAGICRDNRYEHAGLRPGMRISAVPRKLLCSEAVRGLFILFMMHSSHSSAVAARFVSEHSAWNEAEIYCLRRLGFRSKRNTFVECFGSLVGVSSQLSKVGQVHDKTGCIGAASVSESCIIPASARSTACISVRCRRGRDHSDRSFYPCAVSSSSCRRHPGWCR